VQPIFDRLFALQRFQSSAEVKSLVEQADKDVFAPDLCSSEMLINLFLRNPGSYGILHTAETKKQK